MDREFTINRNGETIALTDEERTDCLFYVLCDYIEKAVALIEEETGDALLPEARNAFVSEMLEKTSDALHKGILESVREKLNERP